jgi:hypothetical protein
VQKAYALLKQAALLTLSAEEAVLLHGFFIPENQKRTRRNPVFMQKICQNEMPGVSSPGIFLSLY